MKGTLAINYQDISNAAECLKTIVHHTPVFTSQQFNDLSQAQVFFKCENFQKIGAFKIRGAYYAISRLTPEQKQAGVIAFSAGNHSQAVALASKLLGVSATILIPNDAPKQKIAATKGYGAEVILFDRYLEDREKLTQALASARNLTIIPPYNHPDVMAGQGTAVKELIEQVGEMDFLFIPVGGGGLIAGSAVACAQLLPHCKIIGVEPENANDGQQSFRAGKIITIPAPTTIADGAQSPALGSLTFPIIQELVDDMLTVSDAELLQQMKFFAERMKIIVEPTGCLGAAAVMFNKLNMRDKKIGVVLSGGNIDLSLFQHL